ncbi:hypothetical protein Bbelb_158610 [Branchiostoma belcheri]|nr:hypothetical protein Bbelb_158610 [Branchiostoma belcheri]
MSEPIQMRGRFADSGNFKFVVPVIGPWFYLPAGGVTDLTGNPPRYTAGPARGTAAPFIIDTLGGLVPDVVMAGYRHGLLRSAGNHADTHRASTVQRWKRTEMSTRTVLDRVLSSRGSNHGFPPNHFPISIHDGAVVIPDNNSLLHMALFHPLQLWRFNSAVDNGFAGLPISAGLSV